MNDPENDAERHESVWLLLPWYVNDTLETAERRLVEDHLAACPGCHEELSRSRALAAALRGRQETAPSPHPIQLARLMERVEADERGERGCEALGDDGGSERADGGSVPPPVPAARPADRTAHRRKQAGRPGRPWSRLLGGTPRPVRWALAGQLAALLLLAATVAFGPVRRFQPGSSAPTMPTAPTTPAPARTAAYVTLSAPAAAGESSAAAARPQIRLVFVETATEKQMRYVLLCIRGRLVDGPSPLGAYTLELPAPTSAAGAPEALATPKNTAGAARTGETAPAVPAPRAALAEAAPDSVGTVLAYLRSQPVVRFAEPVAGTTSPSPSSAWQAAPAGAGTVHGSPPPSRP